MITDKSPVTPAFRTRQDALLYSALVLLFLSLPVLLCLTKAVPASALYAAMPLHAGPMQFLYQQIYQEKAPIDILFIGSSRVWSGIDTPLIEKQLSQACGSAKTALTLGFNWSAEDPQYVMLKHLLERRTVRMVVLEAPRVYFNDKRSNLMVRYWLSLDDWSAISGLPAQEQLELYGEMVLASPRKLLSALRPDIWGGSKFSVAADLGALRRKIGFMGAPYVAFNPVPPALAAEDLLYSHNAKAFKFTAETPTPYQMHFLRQTMDLLDRHKIPVVFVHIPFQHECQNPVVIERLCWPSVFHNQVSLLGIPAAQLFAGFTAEQVKELYYDNYHLNFNGNEYFTRTILPGIIYEYKRTSQAK